MNMNVKNQYYVIENYTGSSFLVLTQLFKEIHLINDASVMGDTAFCSWGTIKQTVYKNILKCTLMGKEGS